MNRRRLCASVLASVIASRASAKTENLEADFQATAVSGDQFTWRGAEFRLADILAPRLNDHPDRIPFAESSRRELQNLLDRGIVETRDVSPRDRWGRRVVVVKIHDETGAPMTLQRALAARGVARIAPETEEMTEIRTLLSIEEEARRARIGLWKHRAYRPLNADEAGRAVGGYHLVEGTPTQVSSTRSRDYINFGEDFRTDFTATIPAAVRTQWRRRGIELDQRDAGKIRVRGFVQWINGPSIELIHPMQIERLE